MGESWLGGFSSRVRSKLTLFCSSKINYWAEPVQSMRLRGRDASRYPRLGQDLVRTPSVAPTNTVSHPPLRWAKLVTFKLQSNWASRNSRWPKEMPLGAAPDDVRAAVCLWELCMIYMCWVALGRWGFPHPPLPTSEVADSTRGPGISSLPTSVHVVNNVCNIRHTPLGTVSSPGSPQSYWWELQVIHTAQPFHSYSSGCPTIIVCLSALVIYYKARAWNIILARCTPGDVRQKVPRGRRPGLWSPLCQNLHYAPGQVTSISFHASWQDWVKCSLNFFSILRFCTL